MLASLPPPAMPATSSDRFGKPNYNQPPPQSTRQYQSNSLFNNPEPRTSSASTSDSQPNLDGSKNNYSYTNGNAYGSYRMSSSDNPSQSIDRDSVRTKHHSIGGDSVGSGSVFGTGGTGGDFSTLASTSNFPSSNGSAPSTSVTTPGASGHIPTVPQTQHAKQISLNTSLPSQSGTQPVNQSYSPPFQPSSLRHRHTLQVPVQNSSSNKNRNSSSSTSEVATASGRFSPTTATAPRRASIGASRRPNRSMEIGAIPPDVETAKAAEAIIAKRASKRRRKEEEEDDKVIVGTKVDMNHANWVTAYNMLTGIRFVVSRINAKMDRELTDADFHAKHKFSFDITGNELTPSAKYDFKFKDYSPWVFRHLRTKFGLDPADYLMSLTSKYILSELGSPGKSGSFFYFSRDYKYIIKTIHHGEHRFLRKILKDYYEHVDQNPNTLISQFYGLHRVKTPFGRKIHFVVMNNLFPPHRDIHQTFDLKGSTIGRDFDEKSLESNPRATLKDLNWLRRDMHLELGPTKKRAFLEQVERDVRLLQKLGICDYSLLIGIHDLDRGNKDDIRNNALKVFQPGATSNAEEDLENTVLARTPSKLENARRIRELRKVIHKEVPLTLEASANRLPDDISHHKDSLFYSDDGGMRATHENDEPGDVIYYLGVIDCLTHYGFIKKAELLWKGFSQNKSLLSVNPPDSYGERFLRFITRVVKSPEEAKREKEQQGQSETVEETLDTVEKARTDASRERDSAQPRKVTTVRSPVSDPNGGAMILPIVEETTEGSTSGRTLSRNGSASDSGVEESKSITRRSQQSEQQYNVKTYPQQSFQHSAPKLGLYQEPEDLSFRVATVSAP